MNSEFKEKCYALLRQVPAGKVTTYKALAEALNCRAYQAVGQAMKQNPNLITTPCHRVILSNGGLGGYILGKDRKRALLQAEGIEILDDQIQSLNEVFYHFESPSG